MAQWLLWVTPALWSSNYVIARAADGVIATNALTFFRWALALAPMLPRRAVMYLSPIYAALAARVLLGEAPRWYHAVDATLILPSIYLVTRATARAPTADATIAGHSSPADHRP